ncbi:hypothetical protein GCM10025770_23750 [Viridibacterium curvum]|uniref:SH3 domain-containing protein n=1 Tax=Viridibacterium curvum TaxID=1101404 RepID=A0ABP9QSU1_9RHOO
MRVAAVFVLIGAVLGAQASESSECERIDSRGQRSVGFHPRLSATVSGVGRAWLYAAPTEKCKTKRFIVPGDSVTVYTPYKGWFHVMYINVSTGEDFEAWVKEDRLKITGDLGPR